MKYSLVALFMVLACFSQDTPPMPPHRSAITPPPIPFATPFLHRFPTNTVLLHLPPGKAAAMFHIGNMQIEELLDRVKSNRYNLYLIELHDAAPPPIHAAMISEEDELVLSNYHRGLPQHPLTDTLSIGIQP